MLMEIENEKCGATRACIFSDLFKLAFGIKVIHDIKAGNRQSGLC